MLKKLLYLFTITLLTAAIAQAQSVGIIGSATPGGWDEDTDLTQDADNPDIWTISGLALSTGETKFRQDDDWTVNWGATSFPTGTGEQDGPNIPTAGGTYDITFNSATAEYTFTETSPTYGSIGLIGTGTSIGNFDEDVDMTAIDTIPWVWTLETTLVAGDVKFRADDDWTNNWGAIDWPSGVGTPGGDNIPSVPGDYLVTFNSATGEYSFETLVPLYNTIGVIGDATPGGWDADTDLEQNPNNPSLWSANITFTDGEAKFRAEDDWAVNWGAEDFPMGTAVLEGPNIPVVAGEYNVQFNSATGEYNFAPPISIFETVGIIGDGTGLGWDEDIDMYVDPAQPDQWTVQLHLTTGEVKFRANNAWDVNWGDDGFPTGTATEGGPNIPVFEGDWEITFNATTGVYSFTPVSIGIIGTATAGGWDSDTDMAASNTAGSVWSLDIDLMDGEAKFRQNDDWAINWGEATFPTGAGTQDGPNIPVTAGSYNVSLNTATGDYAFNGSNNTLNLLDGSAIQVFPNPTRELLNINIEAVELQNDVTVRVLNLEGQVISVQQFNQLESLNIDVSNYAAGVYILQLSNNKYLLGKRFSVIK